MNISPAADAAGRLQPPTYLRCTHTTATTTTTPLSLLTRAPRANAPTRNTHRGCHTAKGLQTWITHGHFRRLDNGACAAVYLPALVRRLAAFPLAGPRRSGFMAALPPPAATTTLRCRSAPAATTAHSSRWHATRPLMQSGVAGACGRFAHLVRHCACSPSDYTIAVRARRWPSPFINIIATVAPLGWTPGSLPALCSTHLFASAAASGRHKLQPSTPSPAHI